MSWKETLSEARRRARVNPLAGGLGRKLLFWILVFSLVPLFLSNTVGYVRSDDIIEELVHQYLDGIAEIQALHVRDQLERNRLSLQIVSAGNEFLLAAALRSQGVVEGPMGDLADARRAQEHLRRKLDELAAFESLYLYAPDGRILLTATRPEAGADLPHVVSHPGEPLSVHRSSHLDGAPWLRLSAPVLGPGEDVVAYLAGTVSLASPTSFLDLPEHVAGSVESFLVDEVGRPLFISHPHGHTHYGESLASPLVDRPVGSAARYRNREGHEVIGTSVALAGLPWRLITEAPVDDALGPLRALRELSIVLEVVLALLVLGAAWFVAAGIVAPVRKLVAATRRVGAGELETRVEVPEGDEIGELGSAFNDMTADLQESASRIQELHKREIERASRLATVGELASGVAHEIKNPVVGISNGLDLVTRRVGDDPDLEPIVEEMHHQLHRIDGAVRDLLTFARPSEPRLSRSQGNAVVERALRLVEPAADRAGVKVHTELDPELPRLRIDEEMIGQVVVNLVMNAVQAAGPRGEVRVGTRFRNGTVELTVQDTGPGIPREDLGHIFKPFFTTKHQGTGLGLSITRDLVERHGGRLEAESPPEGGARFTVRLPVNGPPDEEA